MFITVDIGGTKVRVSRVDFDGRAMRVHRTSTIPSALLRRGSDAFVVDLVRFLKSFITADIRGVALTLNGVLRGPRVLFSSLMGGPLNLDLAAVLRDGLGVEVAVDDDLHAMAYAEGVVGAGSCGAPVTILNLGTGIGAVHFENGAPIRGMFGAGLISEQSLWVPELGSFRILDRIVCGRGVSELHSELGGKPSSAVDVFRRHLAGDKVAHRVVDIFAQGLGSVLGMIARFYHPSTISMHGSVAKAWDIVREPAMAEMIDATETLFRPATVDVSAVPLAAEHGVLLQGWGLGA